MRTVGMMLVKFLRGKGSCHIMYCSEGPKGDVAGPDDREDGIVRDALAQAWDSIISLFGRRVPRHSINVPST
jgi:hypothetical protein